MNVLKHMEAVFIATVTLAVSSSYLVDAIPEAHAKAPTALRASANSVPVITVSAKRMTPEEKAQSLREEQKLAAARAKPASAI